MLRQMSPSRSAAGSARTHAITWSVRRIPPAGYPDADRVKITMVPERSSGRGVSTLVLAANAGDRGNEVRAYPRTVGIIETRVFVVIELTRMPSRHDARPAGRRGRAGTAGTQVPRDAGPVLVDVLEPETTPRTGASHTSEVRTYTATEPTSSQLRQCLQSNLETLRKLREQRR
jgi:hypothetical protein